MVKFNFGKMVISEKLREMEMDDKRIAEAKDDKNVEQDAIRTGHGPGVCVEILL